MRILNRFRNGFVVGTLIIASMVSLSAVAQAHSRAPNNVLVAGDSSGVNTGGHSNNGGGNNTGENNNGGNNNQGSGTKSVPEAPYAAVFPLVAIGAAFWVYKKRQEA